VLECENCDDVNDLGCMHVSETWICLDSWVTRESKQIQKWLIIIYLSSTMWQMLTTIALIIADAGRRLKF